ncbi:MAG: hypothetical protein RLZZ500_528 [Bacteroidota bacterium]|jgi:phospholipid/cholesterol/gamma-HCH transport system permease protein
MKKWPFYEEETIQLGQFTEFTGRFFKEIAWRTIERQELFKQCYEFGYRSLPLVSLTGFIMGWVLTLQSRPAMAKFGAESWIPNMVGLSLVREIAPVITALICAGRIASGIGAELGSMRVTEQIDAMEVGAIQPYRFLVVNRTLATTLMLPILVIYADGIGLLGGYLGINHHNEITLRHYFQQVFDALAFSDIIPAVLKTFFFGFFIGMVGCFKGFHANSGTESVGKAANQAVVAASISIFLIDLIAVQLTDLL